MRELPLGFDVRDRLAMPSGEMADLSATPVEVTSAGRHRCRRNNAAPIEWEMLWIDLGGEG